MTPHDLLALRDETAGAQAPLPPAEVAALRRLLARPDRAG